MSRTKGSKNKNQNQQAIPEMMLSAEERIQLIANIIVDRIIDDQANGELLLRQITASKSW